MAVVSLPERPDPSSLTEVVAAEVRALMGRYGVTQTDLCAVLEVSQTGVSKRLRGLIPFDINEIGALASFFGVTPAELLGEQPTPRPNGPDGGQGMKRARRYSKPQPSDPKVVVYRSAA